MSVDPMAFLGEFWAEATEYLNTFDEQLLRLERDPLDSQPVRAMFLAAHSIKGGAAMLGLIELRELSHALEDVLDVLDLVVRRHDDERGMGTSHVPNSAGAKSSSGGKKTVFSRFGGFQSHEPDAVARCLAYRPVRSGFTIEICPVLVAIRSTSR